MFTLSDHPHRRHNPLTDEWVVVSPHRTKRPWQGQVETPPPDTRPAYDPSCYLCPGNERAGGVRNPAYTGTFVFENDFAALLPDVPPGELAEGDPPLLRAVAERGICRVVCYSPRHDLSMGQLEPADLRAVVDAWAGQYHELGALEWARQVLIFENRGAMMGASNPHPHGQVWATSFLPGVFAREHATQTAYHAAHGRTLLEDYLRLELERGERVVCANEHFVALVPFWAVWPFETMVVARRPVATMPELAGPERDGLAAVLKELTTRYDALFQVSFPYSMGFHQAPTDGQTHPGWHLHAHFLPPLLRSATVRKFMVGFELLGEPQRDITPEQAAERLRAAL
ncbi:MAG TPA: UDP-glucose--hexose-1-phosphate uridylyltransferase [Chloroflexaceae bacterium]|nr:UDP-glucose--hexose-1-phosphate uridylyltransferase [Chloroflexaceae bacterium]